jgi:hypothetical protein
MDQVESDAVFTAAVIDVSPDPSAGNTTVVEVMDVVVFYEVSEGVSDKDSDGTQIDLSAVMNPVVCDNDMPPEMVMALPLQFSMVQLRKVQFLAPVRKIAPGTWTEAWWQPPYDLLLTQPAEIKLLGNSGRGVSPVSKVLPGWNMPLPP